MKLIELLQEFGLGRPKTMDLIQEAFCHSSFVNENREKGLKDNERLEFMGDAVLQLYSANFLYQQTPSISEGDMTLMRAQLVSEKALAKFSRMLGLGNFLQLGHGEIKSGGQDRDSILADTFEAFIGAIYLTYGYQALDPILDRTLKKEFLNLNPQDLMDYKTKLQEVLQSDLRKTVHYQTEKINQSDNAPIFEALVLMDSLVLGSGQGPSKKKAQQMAAKNALEKMAL